jgi:hypothetical protein
MAVNDFESRIRGAQNTGWYFLQKGPLTSEKYDREGLQKILSKL